MHGKYWNFETESFTTWKILFGDVTTIMSI